MKDHGINTGLRLPKDKLEKLDFLAKTFNVSRNKMVGLLIDGAEIESIPILSIDLPKNREPVSENRQVLH